MAGFPVVISERGAPFVAVEKGAPLATVAENGRGSPIRVVDKGAPPLIIQGYNVWSPADLFENSEFGSWYDPSFLDTLFQNANGTTPAVPGSPVGLMLDARKEMGPELVTNGNFSDGLMDWVTTGWIVTDGVAYNTSTGPGANIYQNVGGQVGKTYEVIIDVLSVGSAGTLLVYLGTSSFVVISVASGPGEKRIILSPSGTRTSEVIIQPQSLGWSIDNISVREVLNPPLSQPTTAARPTLQPPGLSFDLVDDALTTTLPQAVNGDILIAGTKGSIIEPVSYAAESTFTIGPDTYTGGTPGVMSAVGGVVGLLLIDRTLTQNERDNLLSYYADKGAGGLLP